MKARDYMRMGELVERSGVPRTTIHFYLREGLLHPPTKTGRTIAYYDESHLTRLKKIQELRKGMRVPVAFLRERIHELQEAEGVAAEEPASSPLADGDSGQDPRARRKEEIVVAAIKVFSQKGYHQARIEDIASAIGISKGTFYIYFSNKRELFIDIIDYVFRGIVDHTAEVLKDEKDLRRRFHIRLRIYYDSYAKYKELINILRAEAASEESWPMEKLGRIYRGLIGPVIREFRRASEQGALPLNFDPDLFCYGLLGAIEMMHFRGTLDQKYSADQIIASLEDLLERYITPNPGQPLGTRREVPPQEAEEG